MRKKKKNSIKSKRGKEIILKKIHQIRALLSNTKTLGY